MTRHIESNQFFMEFDAEMVKWEYFNCSFFQCNFEGLDLSNTKFKSQIQFSNCNFTGVKFPKVIGKNTKIFFIDCKLDGINLENVDQSMIEFHKEVDTITTPVSRKRRNILL